MILPPGKSRSLAPEAGALRSQTTFRSSARIPRSGLETLPLTGRSNETRENETYLPGVKLSKALSVTNNLPLALKGAEVVVSSVPSHGVREIFTTAAAGKLISPDTIIVNTAKGIEIETGHTMSALFTELGFREPVVLSGPTFAAEVARSLPCAIVAASRNETDAEAVQKLFSSECFRVYTNKDVIGVEIGGALKNVVAIASGISDGLKLGTNARAALITRGLAETTRLGMKMGSERETFFGLSGLGDLVLTCTGPLSRKPHGRASDRRGPKPSRYNIEHEDGSRRSSYQQGR